MNHGKFGHIKTANQQQGLIKNSIHHHHAKIIKNQSAQKKNPIMPNSIIKPPATRIWYAISLTHHVQTKSKKNAFTHENESSDLTRYSPPFQAN
jgi:hypothetical protein